MHRYTRSDKVGWLNCRGFLYLQNFSNSVYRSNFEFEVRIPSRHPLSGFERTQPVRLALFLFKKLRQNLVPMKFREKNTYLRHKKACKNHI